MYALLTTEEQNELKKSISQLKYKPVVQALDAQRPTESSVDIDTYSQRLKEKEYTDTLEIPTMEGSEKSYGAALQGQKESFKFVTELCTFKEKFEATKGFHDKI